MYAEWQRSGREIYINLAAHRLVAFPDYEVRHGYRWAIIPLRNGVPRCAEAICSAELTAEAEPYRTENDAITACTNYYTRNL